MEKNLDKIIIGIIITCFIIILFSSNELLIQNIKSIIFNNFILFIGGLIVVVYMLKHYGKI